MTTDPAPLEAPLERAPYLDDDGFTAKVMAGLPPRRRSRRAWALGLASGAAALTALAVLPAAVRVALAAIAVPAALPPGLLVVGAAAAGAALWAGAVAVLEG